MLGLYDHCETRQQKGDKRVSYDEKIARTGNKLLSDKTAIVTGASSGIGHATALTLAQAGAAVVINARRKDRLDKLASEIAKLGGKALTVVGDASIQADIDLLLKRSLAWNGGGGKYDIVVVNAGRGLAGGILSSDESQWQELYHINVLGAAYLMRRAGQYMVQRKSGDIVVIGSVVGRNISPFSGFYGSSKFAIGAIAEGLRREICPQGVRVSVVMPGVVLSEFQNVAGYDEENFGKGIAHFGKLLEPQAIANGICWLLTLPPHVNVNEIMIRPTGQNYP
jgi:NADP-dependent 3-hydroxy acid dehydrogenase YdfG